MDRLEEAKKIGYAEGSIPDWLISEVERLRVLVEGYRHAVAERDRYRKALEEIADNNLEGECCKDIATTALKGGGR